MNPFLSYEIVSFRGQGLGPEDVKNLYFLLRDNNTVKVLDLSNNKIGDEGVKFIVTLLKHNKTLQIINIGHDFGELAREYILGEWMRRDSSLMEVSNFSLIFHPTSDLDKILVTGSFVSDFEECINIDCIRNCSISERLKLVNTLQRLNWIEKEIFAKTSICSADSRCVLGILFNYLDGMQEWSLGIDEKLDNIIDSIGKDMGFSLAYNDRMGKKRSALANKINYISYINCTKEDITYEENILQKSCTIL